MAAKKKKHGHENVAAQNRKARHDYVIEENFEAGIMLKGTEVKSLREGHASIGESYASEENGELFLVNAYIPEYSNASAFSHDSRAPRKLLLHRREIAKLRAAIARKGKTLIPLAIYFNDRGIAKVDLGLAHGKSNYDKRQSDKDADWKRQQSRLMHERDRD